MNLARPAYWTEKSVISLLLWPLSIVFRLNAWIRRRAYQSGLMSLWRSPVPVVIIGNITVGGAGKTPLVIALSELLSRAGYNIGIVTRGYGGTAEQNAVKPMSVSVNSDASVVGDESVLIARRTGLPVVISKNRVAAVQHLIAHHSIDCVLCDDGLQHYALQRDVEIAVVDADYRFGNGFCMPAGPLREPVSRLETVDFTVFSGAKNSDTDGSKAYQVEPGYSLKGDELVDLTDESNRLPLADFGGTTVHAVAGIASPDNFYKILQSNDIKTIQHEFGDHASFTKSDFEFDDSLPVLMTEKDMVKCRDFGLHNLWYLPVSAYLDDELSARIVSRIEQVISKRRENAD